ncbi:hypothetical protein [Roseinatronobacter thiooxidans]|uniref:hypothetical protein n=1 Tax=Roseinatronobacter thiooxidans TaxID=121821 RepID=UPI00116022D7|nr:hypothetical protein [Roseinatronobacter thiooxidans]
MRGHGAWFALCDVLRQGSVAFLDDANSLSRWVHAQGGGGCNLPPLDDFPAAVPQMLGRAVMAAFGRVTRSGRLGRAGTDHCNAKTWPDALMIWGRGGKAGEAGRFAGSR